MAHSPRPAGITPAQLAERANAGRSAGNLSPDALKAWLLDTGLATEHDGLLCATEHAIRIAGGLANFDLPRVHNGSDVSA